MRLVLVHHADTVRADVDAQRPLSARGFAQAEALARAVQARGAIPGVIWHSGKLRARQTAEPFLRLAAFAEFKMVRGLGPDDDATVIMETLGAETRDILIVAHMPNLSALLERLTGDRGGMPFHGAVGLERGDSGWKELWREDTPRV